eukprot:1180115-Prorocentrum_minimum.AAC.3
MRRWRSSLGAETGRGFGGGGRGGGGRFVGGGGRGDRGDRDRGGRGGGRFGGGGGSKSQQLIRESMLRTLEKEIDPEFANMYPGYSESTLRCLQTVDEEKINYELAERLVRYIADELEEGAILVFLPGMAEIRTLYDMLAADPCAHA